MFSSKQVYGSYFALIDCESLSAWTPKQRQEEKVGEKEDKLRSEKTNCSINTSFTASSFPMLLAQRKMLPHHFSVWNGNMYFKAPEENESVRLSMVQMLTYCCLLAQSFDCPDCFFHCLWVSSVCPSQRRAFAGPAEDMLFLFRKHKMVPWTQRKGKENQTLVLQPSYNEEMSLH